MTTKPDQEAEGRSGKPERPKAGGSYIREKDGTLTRTEFTAPAQSRATRARIVDEKPAPAGKPAGKQKGN